MKENKKNFLKLFKNKGWLAPLIILVIAIGITVPLTSDSYAAYTSWKGYTIAHKSGSTGYTTGKFCIHLAKNNKKFATTTTTIKVANAKNKNASHALFTELDQNQRKFTFSNSGSTGWITVGSSTTTKYNSYRRGLNAKNVASWHYVFPYIKLKVPRGYKYSDSLVAYDKAKYSESAALGLHKTNVSGKDNEYFFTGRKGPYSSDTTLTGYVNLNIRSAALHTRISNKGSTKGKTYITNESLSINFVPNTTTIKYNANGGTGVPANQTKTYDTALKLSTKKPTRTGYTFTGWNTTAAGTGTKYASGGSIAATSYPAASSATLYAQWVVNKYTLTAKGNATGVTIPATSGWTVSGVNASKSVNYGATYGTLPTPTRSGHTFAGWYTAASGGTKVATTTKIGTANATIYAHWTPKNMTITYNANGGTGTMTSQTKKYGTALTLNPNKFVKSNSSFKGWNTAANGSGTQYSNKAVVAATSYPNSTAITLYAQWATNGATCEEWNGNTVTDTSSTSHLGYETGHICLHLAKEGELYDSDIVTVTPVNTIGTAEELYTTHLCPNASSCAQRWKFSNSSSTNIRVASSDDTEHEGFKVSLDGYSLPGFNYTEPALSVRVPKGYKFSSYTIPDTTDLPQPALIKDFGSNQLHEEGHPNIRMFEEIPTNQKPAKDDDTWVTGYLGLNVEAAGVVTRNINDTKFRIFQSANIDFVPNETVIKFDPNGGEGEMDEQQHTYGKDEIELEHSIYEKENAAFKGWICSANVLLSDGTEVEAGTLISDGATINKLAFPGDEEVTFTAQWQEDQKFTVKYYSDSNGTIKRIPSYEELFANQKLSGAEETPKKGYETIGWKCSKDVTLDGGTEIKANTLFDSDVLTSIIVKENFDCTVFHNKEKYIVKYVPIEGVTWDKDIEIIEFEDPPTNKFTVDEGVELEGFISNKDVTLTDGTIIKSGDIITKDQLYKIKVDANMELTPVFKDQLVPKKQKSVKKNPKTGDIIKPYMAIAVLTFLGVTFFTILREDRKSLQRDFK